MPELIRDPGLDSSKAGAPIPATSVEEMERILSAQRLEVEWWGDRKAMQTQEDISQEIAAGRAVRVGDVGQWFKISANVPAELRVLEKQTADLLEEVANAWGQRLQELGIVTADGTSDAEAKNPFWSLVLWLARWNIRKNYKRKGFLRPRAKIALILSWELLI